MILSLFAIASVAGTAGAASQTLTVDDDFSDSEDTDGDTEYQTLQAAINAADPGATIEVNEGTYNSTVIDKEVSVVATGARDNTVIIDSADDSNFALKVGADDVTVRGFTIVAQENEFGLVVEDMVDTHVDNLLAENNHFTNVDGERAQYLVKVNAGGADNPQQATFRNNRFTGWTLHGFGLDADNSLATDNTFHVKSTDGTRGSIVLIRGDSNTLQNTDVNFTGNSYNGVYVTGTGHTVTSLMVNGHLNHHQHQSDRLDQAIRVFGASGVTFSDISVEESEVGVLVDGGSDHITLRDVDARNQKYYDGLVVNGGFDLYIGSNTNNVTVDGFAAMSTEIETNVHVAGEDHTLGNIRSTTDTHTGIFMNADDSKIMGAHIENKNVGINLNTAHGSGVWTSDIMSNGIGIAAHSGDGYVIESNNGIQNNGFGVYVVGSNATVRDNTIANNDVGLKVDDTQNRMSNVEAHWNDIVGNDRGIWNLGTNDVMAQMNWYGSKAGPSGAAKLSDMSTLGHGDSVSEGVVYDPFLTDSKDNVPHDWEQVEKFGHDFELEGEEGWQTIAFPGHGEDDIGETLRDLGNRPGVMVWAYDQDDPQGPWLTGAELANRSVESLDAFIVTGLENDAEITADHLDSTSPPNSPGQHDLDAGWNFVGAPQYGEAQTVYQSTSSLGRLIHVYEQPESQPYGDRGDAKTFEDNFATASSNHVSAYTGYWVWSDSDGEVSAVLPGGVSACDEISLLNQSQTCPP